MNVFQHYYSVIAIFLISMSICQINAEYLVFKTDSQGQKSALNQAEFAQVYPVLMRYQFPLTSNPYSYNAASIAEFNQKIGEYKKLKGDEKKYINADLKVATDILQKIGSLNPLGDEKSSLATKEQEFIQSKMKQINANFGIAYVPTTLFEMFALLTLNKISDKEQAKILNDVEKLTELAQIASRNGDLKLFLLSFLSSNYLDGIKDLYFSVNNKIVTRLNFNLQDLNVPAAQKLAVALMDEMYDGRDSGNVLRLSQASSRLSFAHFHDQGKQLLQGAVALDFDAQKNNKKIIWRGTNRYSSPLTDKTEMTAAEYNDVPDQKFIDATIKLSIEPTGTGVSILAKYYSNSYGNSLFAGRNDIDAMAFKYMMKKSFIGYGLLIDKANYLIPDSPERQLFFLTPLSTLAGLFVRGELFHARSRVALCTDTVPELDGLPPQFTYTYVPKTTKGNFLAFNISPQNPGDYENKFSDYLVKNVRIARNDSGLDEKALKASQMRTPLAKFPGQEKLLYCPEATKEMLSLSNAPAVASVIETTKRAPGASPAQLKAVELLETIQEKEKMGTEQKQPAIMSTVIEQEKMAEQQQAQAAQEQLAEQQEINEEEPLSPAESEEELAELEEEENWTAVTPKHENVQVQILGPQRQPSMLEKMRQKQGPQALTITTGN